MPRLQRAGVSLFYNEAGSGSPPILLVHGWGCDHTFMAPQFAHFQQAHRVLAVDLRGHGQSDQPQQAYSIAGFADDLAWMCHALTLERPVVVGHSMGGAIALELAAQRPAVPSAIVLLDSAVFPARGAWAGVQPVIAQLHTPGYRDVLRQFIGDVFFLPTDDPQRKAQIIAAMLATPQHVLASAFEELFRWDAAAAAGQCQVPALYIASTRPRGDVAQFQERCPHLVHGQVVSAGHFVQLEVPQQVHAMIERFLAMHLRAPGGATEQ
jgi:pimeloyl-ACP methyl ester carboxylesterase